MLEFPASFAQQRLFFLDQIQPESPLYNIMWAGMLRGDLRVDVLQQALDELVCRHESLRTTFTLREGEPVQVIAPRLQVPISVVDLSDVPEADRESRALSHAKKVAREPFDLGRGPLVRCILLRLSSREHMLLLPMHHIISDGWSMPILVRELSTLYNARSSGRPSTLPELRIQYADFAQWQREWMSGEVLDKQLRYWRGQLGGGLVPLELPADRPRPSVPSFSGAIESLSLPQALRDSINRFSKDHGLTPFMTFLAIFQTLLHRYTTQDRIVVGSPIANRNRVETENIIGFLTNTLVLSTDFSGNPCVSELLERVRDVALGAYEHQDLPFEKLVEELRPERVSAYTPIVQAMFVFQNAPVEELRLSGLTASPVVIHPDTAKFDLTLSIEEKGSEYAVTMEYSVDLFDPETISRMLDHFQVLLESALADPAQRVAMLPLSRSVERDPFPVERAGAQVAGVDDRCIHQLLEDQAERNPDAVALSFEDQSITFGELNARANRLARVLRRRGVASDSIVAVLEDRTPEMIVAILGILKAGGAYLPIDLQTPPDRIVSMLRDSNAAALLTSESGVRGASLTLRGSVGSNDDITVTSPRPQIKDLDKLPFPNRDLVDYRKYNQYIGDGVVKRGISIIPTRGCPYRCLYCHKLWPKTHVARSAQNVFDEVMRSYDRGYRAFSIIDDVFNLNRRNSEAFFELIIKNNLKIRIQCPNGLRGDILTSDYIDLMAEAGVIEMALALETASPRLQKLVGKNLNIERFRENVVYVCKAHPHMIIDLLTMVGFPTETEEEALMTLDFIKGIHWLHFPVISTLKIFPNTEMARLAMEHGVTREAIERDAQLAFHEPGEAMPFHKSFIREYQMDFVRDYFLLPERLEHVVPAQKRVLTHEEIIAKYNSYLPGVLETCTDLKELIGEDGFYVEEALPGDTAPISVSGPDSGAGGTQEPGGLRVLLLDLSQHFSHEPDQLVDMVEAPIGLMYLLTYLNEQYGSKIDGKILKAMIDFDSFDELKTLIDSLRPEVIGIRTLSLYKKFFHQTVALVRKWCPSSAIIAGGPYATSEPSSVLQDRNVDAAVLGEGEITFSELIGKVLENDGRLPPDRVLEGIPGLASASRGGHQIVELADVGCQVMLLDAAAREIAGESASNLDAAIDAGNLAYVIYTSGSTGLPKGVMLCHANVVRLFNSTHAWYSFDDRDVWALFHSYAFDFSVWEMFGALIYGGRLVLVPYWVSRSPTAFHDLLLKQQVTVLNQIPSAFYQLIQAHDAAAADDETALRLVIFGGEALETTRLARWFGSHGDQRPALANMYGITETTVHVTYRAIRKDDLPLPGGSPIGRPIPDLRVYLLDPGLGPVPVGVPGEIHVGGPGVARGYLHRPDLTAERFIPNPVSKGYGSRVYKTGDLARRLPAGDMEFLGRADEQVKVRGFRIEPAEIEFVLGQHPAVKETAVAVREDLSGDKRLLAYVVPEEAPPNATELRRFLKQKLPEYMIPSAFVILDALPLTPGGKVDRRALPMPGSERPDLEQAYAAPQTPTEETLAAYWSKVLGIQRVGIDDGFFALGGDSILAIRLVALAKEGGLAFSLQQLFQNQTVHKLARAIEASIPDQESSSRSEPFSLISEADREKMPDDAVDAYPITAVQLGMLYDMELTPDLPFYHNVGSFRVRSRFEPEAFRKAASRVVARHAAFRTSFDLARYTRPLQLVHRRVEPAIHMEDLSHLPPEEQEQALDAYFVREKTRRFDLSAPPLLRYSVHVLSEEVFHWTVTEFHPIMDGWSINSANAELFQLYFALLDGESPPPAQPPRTSYRDYVALELAAVESADQRSFWAERLAGCGPTLLPRWLPSPRGAGAVEIRSLDLPIPQGVRDGLENLARSAAVPLKSVLLSAHIRVLALLSGRPDVLTCVPYNGRLEQRDGDTVLGLFLNDLPFRMELPGGTWTEFVRRTYEVEKELLPFRHYPVVQLQDNWDRSLLFEVVFTFNHFHVIKDFIGAGKVEYWSVKRSEPSSFTLAVGFIRHPASSEMRLILDYNATRMCDTQMRAIAGYYSRALSLMAERPLERHESQSLLSEAERHQVVREWNDTGEVYEGEECVHELIEVQAEMAPDAVALIVENEQITYRELNRRANRLANRLSQLGVGPDVLVGVCLERSLETVAALLGVLKAGGAYVPAPPEVLGKSAESFIEKTSARVLLAPSNVVAGVALPEDTFCLDPSREESYTETDEYPRPEVTAENLACALFRSDSDLAPVTTHGSLANYCRWSRSRYAEANCGMVPDSSLPPEAAALAIIVSLAAGRGVRLSPASAGAGRIRIVHEYGLAETGVACCAHETREGPFKPALIGRPIAGARSYILDSYMQPVPIGTAGTLYLGGACVGRGYLDDPQGTAERLVPDPFGHEPGARIHRSRDVARFLPDGNIELIGLQGDQVQSLGPEIERGEIPAAPTECPDVVDEDEGKRFIEEFNVDLEDY